MAEQLTGTIRGQIETARGRARALRGKRAKLWAGRYLWARGVTERGNWRREHFAALLEWGQGWYAGRLTDDGDLIDQLLALLRQDIAELEGFAAETEARLGTGEWKRETEHAGAPAATPPRRVSQRRESHRSRPGHRRTRAASASPPGESDSDGPGEAGLALALAPPPKAILAHGCTRCPECGRPLLWSSGQLAWANRSCSRWGCPA